jgi:YVTN family beta-propeller protein
MKRVALLTFLAFLSISSITVTPVSKIKVGKSPTYVEMSSDGKRLYVTDFASDEVAVVDTATNRVTSKFYAGYEPLGLAVSPTGDKIFVTNLSNGLVKALSTTDFDILDDIKVGGRPSNVAIAPNGLQVFVTNYGRGKYGKVDFLDASTHRILGEVEIGIKPMAAALPGGLLYSLYKREQDFGVPGEESS